MIANRPYHELRFYSVIHDSEVSRLSMYDDRGSEFFTIVKMDGTGRQNREAKRDALEGLEAKINEGVQPGEVELDGPSQIPD